MIQVERLLRIGVNAVYAHKNTAFATAWKHLVILAGVVETVGCAARAVSSSRTSGTVAGTADPVKIFSRQFFKIFHNYLIFCLIFKYITFVKDNKSYE